MGIEITVTFSRETYFYKISRKFWIPNFLKLIGILWLQFFNRNVQFSKDVKLNILIITAKLGFLKLISLSVFRGIHQHQSNNIHCLITSIYSGAHEKPSSHIQTVAPQAIFIHTNYPLVILVCHSISIRAIIRIFIKT